MTDNIAPRADGLGAALDCLRLVLPECRAEVHSYGAHDRTLVGHARSKRRAEFRAGRIAASRAGMALAGTPFIAGRGADGAPVWPRGLRGSISHSAGQAVALLGRADAWSGLGVDIEGALCPEVAKDIAPVALTAAERSLFGTSPLAVGMIFSAKESLFKALSPLIGRRFDFDAAQLSANAPQLCLTCDLAPGWQAGRKIDVVMIPFEAGVLTAVALPAL
ncbi:4'-phosphopantetheinyl transferase [Falsirhodobacter sp. alg1]|uniref:4'-phosphopantetheinyl transferase family protein n=1 Tax=Falsirhodobacter sp. alg1 TaxID=1472418 RepID=UPI000786AB7E|nr:4'-phosphopantetheinyl transferase superfamily protein [Falsirhodobacter sp. alg1]